MKKFSFLCILFFSLFTLSIQSCEEEDPCETIICGEFGNCDDGNCICEAGFSTDASGACTVPANAKFIGTYSVVETCVAGTGGGSSVDNYTTTIASPTGNDPFALSITSIYFSGVELTGTVDPNGQAFGITQTTSAGVTLSNSNGTIDESTGVITITVTASIGNQFETCTAVLTPQ